MNDAQKDDLIRLHRLAAHRERAYRTQLAQLADADTLRESRRAWEDAENELLAFRESLFRERNRAGPDNYDGQGIDP